MEEWYSIATFFKIGSNEYVSGTDWFRLKGLCEKTMIKKLKETKVKPEEIKMVRLFIFKGSFDKMKTKDITEKFKDMYAQPTKNLS
ncbi:MAG: hypothetical protein QXG39_00055 [Candidatus Aenigmatarchaeota archaeon]